MPYDKYEDGELVKRVSLRKHQCKNKSWLQALLTLHHSWGNKWVRIVPITDEEEIKKLEKESLYVQK